MESVDNTVPNEPEAVFGQQTPEMETNNKKGKRSLTKQSSAAMKMTLRSGGGTGSTDQQTVPDPKPTGQKMMQKKPGSKVPNFDSARCLKVLGLPTSLFDENAANFTATVVEILNTTFSIPTEAVEKVVRFPRPVDFLDETEQDSAVCALILFLSRVHKHRVFTQRAKLEQPMTVETIGHWPEELESLDVDEDQNEDEILTTSNGTTNQQQNNAVDFVVSDEVIDYDNGGEAEIGDDQTVEHREGEQEEEQEDEMEEDPNEVTILENVKETPVNKKTSASTAEKTPTIKAKSPSVTEINSSFSQDSIKSDADQAAVEQQHGEVDENGEVLAKDEENKDSPDSKDLKRADYAKKKIEEAKIDWEGAPEFQWKTPVQVDDRNKLVFENVSAGDFENPWLYQTMMRAKEVDFSCTSTSFRGNIDHNPLRKGHLTLTFHSDSQAMAQAVNGLVSMRTRPNKRLKIYLPQTGTTMRMKGLLEKKLGRIVETNLKSRQLLVRGIDADINEEEIGEKMATQPGDIETVEIRNDAAGRRCALVTFVSPETATRTHMKRDEIRLGPKGKAWARVYYAQDIIIGSLLTKVEAKYLNQKEPAGGPNTNINNSKKMTMSKPGKEINASIKEKLDDIGAKTIENITTTAANKTNIQSASGKKEVDHGPVKRTGPVNTSNNNNTRKRQRSHSPSQPGSGGTQQGRKRGRGGTPRAQAMVVSPPARSSRGNSNNYNAPFRGANSNTRGGRTMNRGRGGMSGRGPGRGAFNGPNNNSFDSRRNSNFSNNNRNFVYNGPSVAATRPSPWANTASSQLQLGSRNYGPVLGAGYRTDPMDSAIREQREQMVMQQQLLRQQELIGEMAAKLRRDEADLRYGYRGNESTQGRSSFGGYSDNRGGYGQQQGQRSSYGTNPWNR